MKFKPWFKKILYTTLVISWCTGLSYYIANNWFMIDGEFGPEKQPWQYNVLMLHGAAAFIMLMAFGSILTHHVPNVWRTKRLRKIGITLTSFIVIQSLSAYLLYYLANEFIRDITSYLHLIIGLSLPLALILHIIIGKKKPFKKQ